MMGIIWLFHCFPVEYWVTRISNRLNCNFHEIFIKIFVLVSNALISPKNDLKEDLFLKSTLLPFNSSPRFYP